MKREENEQCQAANPFMCMRNRCITYAACKYVTFSTFNALNIRGGSPEEAG